MSNEFNKLVEKANSIGLTIEEKMRFASLSPKPEPKCCCYKLGEGCKLHGIRYEITYDS